MKLAFLGTRGEIEKRTKRHGLHTALLATYRRRRVMIDCGRDWLGRIGGVGPHAIVLTHAHPDHAWGLADGARAPVYATAETRELLADYPLDWGRVLKPGRSASIEGLRFEPFTVEHSTRCPAVGYRVTAGNVCIFYVPDVVYIPDSSAALAGVKLYVGDAASLSRPLIRKRGDRLIGHSPVRRQLAWCEKEGVPRAVFTHCGSPVVAEHNAAGRQIREWGRQRGIDAQLAYDNLEMVLR